ncbi:MAG: hypothetical protein J6K48_05840 [Lachnospiraceae bacterium]|nr:hypothetical protein [Lachnospiraceae bacterium]
MEVVIMLFCFGVMFLMLSIIFLIIRFITRKTRDQNKQEKAETIPTWRAENLTSDQRRLVKEEYKAYRARVYEGHSEVEKFEQRKTRWIWLLIVYGIVMKGIAVFMGNGGITVSNLIMIVLAGMGMNTIFLLAAMGPKWRLAIGLYMLVFWNLVTFITGMAQVGITTFTIFIRALAEGFKRYPLMVCVDILSWIYILLILLTAIWLTLVRHNRELAEQSEELHVQLQKFKPMGI